MCSETPFIEPVRQLPKRLPGPKVWTCSLPALLSLLVLALSGCGYMVGNGFNPDIKTVSVPIFENDTFRRGLEYQLTEAVQKRIQTGSPYRLARGNDADTRLTGRIVQTRKDVLGENANDDPRQLQFSIMVRVTWENLRTGEIIAQNEIPVAPEAVPLIAQAGFAPELGQSQATAIQTVVNQLAKQVVNMMEVTW
ncbi:MAG: LptE family protein [Planctomycetes bacterium]|nr:LptE family protein [Planctomycetota bacterium]